MKIGGVEINGRVFLAPMAGVTDMPFRQLCKEQGAALEYTEMISAKALYYKNKNTMPLLAVSKNGPAAVQLFGNEPQLLAEEAAKLAEGPYALFDVNMGCPVPKVVNNGEGSALMKDPPLIGKIVEAMVKAQPKPVTVKIRKGFDGRHINAVEIAQIAEASGAAAVAVHGRTREDYYHGTADWDIIRQVKESVQIPVIGSGDLFSPEDVKNMLDETGVDAVMIARGARGNPWIFRDVNRFLATGELPDRPSVAEVKTMIRRQLQLLIAFLQEMDLSRKRADRGRTNGTESVAVRQMRTHVSWYSQGYPGAAAFRREINQADTPDEFYQILDAWGEES